LKKGKLNIGACIKEGKFTGAIGEVGDPKMGASVGSGVGSGVGGRVRSFLLVGAGVGHDVGFGFRVGGVAMIGIMIGFLVG
jgi:hypothetical protein